MDKEKAEDELSPFSPLERFQITKIADSLGKTIVGAKYDSRGEVIELATDDGRTYYFRFDVDEDNKIAREYIFRPTGEITRVTFQMAAHESDMFYSVEDTGLGSKTR